MSTKGLCGKSLKSCAVCNSQVNNLYVHLLDVHKIKVEVNVLNFRDPQEFITWKEKMEKKTVSRYVKHSGVKNKKNGVTVTYYHCHRDGNYNPRGKNKRRLKTIGSNKMNGNCPSLIKVEQSCEGLRVSFVATHVGHSCDIARMVLTTSEKDKIAAKVNLKIPLEDILDEIRNSMTEKNLERIHLTNKQDIRNIIVQYKLENDESETNSIKDIDTWVKHMKQHSDFIRFYKPQGTFSGLAPQLKSDDFCLILSNSVQLEVLQKFGSDVICIDRTHGFNEHDYQLFAILVFDEKRNGLPCAFMFSNREDLVVMKIFFKTILSNLKSNVSPKYFMTDVDEISFSAWSALHPNSKTQQLYCEWHVDRAWRQNLQKVQMEDKKIDIYKKIKMLMHENDKISFNVMSQSLLQELYSDEQTVIFAKYFERFIQDAPKWAHCWRLHSDLNTSTSMEVFHINLKVIYLSGRKAKKLIKTIHAMQKFLRDKIFHKVISLCKDSISHKLSLLQRRHITSLDLPDDTVHKISEKEWNVFSDLEVYTVSTENKSCSCCLRCDICRACLHSFTCTCTDSAVLWNMCKHIHLVCGTFSPEEASENNEEIKNQFYQEPQSCHIDEIGHLELKKHHLKEEIDKITDEIKTDTDILASKKFFMAFKMAMKASRNSRFANDFLRSTETSIGPLNKWVPL